MSGALTRRTITVWSEASPEPQIVTIESDSSKATIAYGCRRRQLIIRLSFNYLNLPMSPLNVITLLPPVLITEARSCPTANDDNLRQEERFEISDITTPLLMVRSVNAWGKSSDRKLFYSDENQMISLSTSPSFRTPPAITPQPKPSPAKSFPKIAGILLYNFEACVQRLPSKKSTQDSEWNFDLHF